MAALRNGGTFPALTFNTVGGGSLALPDACPTPARLFRRRVDLSRIVVPLLQRAARRVLSGRGQVFRTRHQVVACYLQSTGLVIAPDGTVIAAVCSPGPSAGLVADDVAGLVHHIKSQS